MGIIRTYLDGLNSGNPDTVAELFTEDCLFDDRAPRLLFGKEFLLHGREPVREFFRSLLTEHRVSASLLADMGTRALYNVMIDRNVLPCKCVLQQQQNQIKEMHISLR